MRDLWAPLVGVLCLSLLGWQIRDIRRGSGRKRAIMVLITSPSNPRVSKLQARHTARGRKKHGFFLMEGPHLLEALLDANLLPDEVYYQPELVERTAQGQALL